MQQLKKGVLEMLVLEALCDDPTYGYELLGRLKERSGGLFILKEGTLYPILYRLEDEGLISSHAGAKSCASVTPEQMVGIRSQLLETDAQTLVEAMKQMGVTREEALELIKKLW